MRHCAALFLMACLLSTAAGGRGSAAEEPGADEQLLRDAKIGADDAALLGFLKQRAIPVDAARLKGLVRQLGSEDFDAREEASRLLTALGAKARPYLEPATKDADAEIARRAEECLKRIETGSTSQLVGAAVRVLAKRHPAGTVETLLDYVPQADEEGVSEEIRQGLTNLAVRDGKAEPALVTALSDKSPSRRTAAGVALAGVAGQRDAVRKLLQDDDPSVRLHVGLALARARDKEALPALIALLDEPALKRPERGQVESLLFRLAEDRAPTVPSGGDAAARRKYRDAWASWWKEAGPTLDGARLEEAARTHGYTLILLLDQNVALELDAANRPRLRFEGLQFPLDVQLLADDHLLTAEHHGNRIVERDRTGKVVWEYPIDEPIVAQRLPNGNTFIATHQRAFEVDAAKKEVANYPLRGGESIMRARKLPGGEVALVTQLGASRFVVIDKNGKELRSFGVAVNTSGGRIDVLPNGHVLVPENFGNRVVEHDVQGRVVWEVQVDEPIAALRLPNGNTLITSMRTDIGAIEVDPAGKQVWQYKADTRVTRAIRR